MIFSATFYWYYTKNQRFVITKHFSPVGAPQQ